MRVTKSFKKDQETVLRFLDVLGGGSTVLGTSKLARPGFFIIAHDFIRGHLEEEFFKKEELLLRALENSGFPPDEGPIGAMRSEQEKCRNAANLLITASKEWQAGVEDARAEVGWAASEYTSTFRKHLDRLNNLIFPLLEQNLSTDDEHRIAEGLNTIAFETSLKGEANKYIKLIESLEDELGDWK
jgi:hemerythrin-like domain-containing protein